MATIAPGSNLCYHLFEMDAQLSLGEYIRRLRRGQKCSLQTVAERTGLSYSHLSRVENDSSVPKADTVARIADALGGDLKLMLEKADCLPRQILDRMLSQEQMEAGSFRRARLGGSFPAPDEVDSEALALARAHGLSEAEAQDTARAILSLLRLDPGRRVPIEKMIRSLYSEGHDNEG